MKRIETVDALRGFAIIGILLLHSIEHFNFLVYPDNALQSEGMVSLNKNIWDTMFFIFGSKAYGIFALLFGFTFHLQYSRQSKKDIDFGPRFMWRMLLLFCFGWINAILFPGEILLIYAILSPVLFFIRHLSNGGVLLVSVIFLLQPVEIYNVVCAFFNDAYIIKPWNTNLWGGVMEYINSGMISEMAKNSYKGFVSSFAWSFNTGRLSQASGLFALGLYFGRIGLFEKNRVNNIKWAKVLVISSIAFIPLFIVNKTIQSDSGTIQNAIRGLSEVWKNLAQLLAFVALFNLLSYSDLFTRIIRPLNSYGRMSLSNYVLQSLVGGLIFYPYGLGLAFKLNIFYSLILGFVLMIIFIVLCNLWFRKFRQGPLEMVWHYFTWINIPGLNKKLRPALIQITRNYKRE